MNQQGSMRALGPGLIVLAAVFTGCLQPSSDCPECSTIPSATASGTAASSGSGTSSAATTGTSSSGSGPESSTSGSSGGGGGTTGPSTCQMDPGADVFTDIADIDTNEALPGRPAVAAGTNQYLVVSPRVDGGEWFSQSSVVAALVDKDRTIEKSFSVVEGLAGAISVDAAFDGTNFLVVYTNGGLVGVRLAPDGTPVGGPIAIASTATGSSPVTVDPPALAFGGGTYLVVYPHGNPSDSQGHLYAKAISPDGTVSAEIVISEASGGQDMPAVTFDGENFLVVWQDGRNRVDLFDTDIYAARVAPDGTVLDPSGIPVGTAPGQQITPHAVFDGTRDIVVWYDAIETSLIGDGNIRGARLGRDGTLIDGPPENGGFVINDGPNVKDRPRAIKLGQGTLVVWGTPGYAGNGGAGLFGAQLGADGLPVGATDGVGITLSGQPEQAGEYMLPMVAALDDRGLVVWLDVYSGPGHGKHVLDAVLCPLSQ